MINKKIQICLLSLTISLLSACSSGIPRKPVNELPSDIEIVSVNFSNAAWKLRLTHRQKENRINGVIGCDLGTDNDNTLAFDGIELPELSYQLTEVIDVPAIPTKLETTDMPKKINYQLYCELTSENFKTEVIRKNSVLYRVPGEEALYR
ncbi:hypothetical protein [Marinicella rhabdoformis]|uniref:hypothetical protein n=1 Tax=Marinicella rhabdoformis TaxID=2580566 RepID=UPI0012AEBCB8|nr:hypothetical protein [Marinicella rhabdoformis]